MACDQVTEQEGVWETGSEALIQVQQLTNLVTFIDAIWRLALLLPLWCLFLSSEKSAQLSAYLGV